jgi:hypothetical protein
MRSALAVACSIALLSTMGCAMCASPHDYSYAAFGGKVQRTNRTCGRVGSILDPAAEPYALASVETIVSPTPADEQILDPSWGPEFERAMPDGAEIDPYIPAGEELLPPPFESGEPADAVPWEESLPAPSEWEPGAPLPDMDVTPGGY